MFKKAITWLLIFISIFTLVMGTNIFALENNKSLAINDSLFIASEDVPDGAIDYVINNFSRFAMSDSLNSGINANQIYLGTPYVIVGTESYNFPVLYNDEIYAIFIVCSDPKIGYRCIYEMLCG